MIAARATHCYSRAFLSPGSSYILNALVSCLMRPFTTQSSHQPNKCWSVIDARLAARSAMQNLREAIAGYRSRLAQETNERKRDALLAVALEYLERCCALQDPP